MTTLTRASNHQSVSLSKQIASSGEGEVWETNLSGYLAKIYHNPTPERIKKLEVMIANPPDDPMLRFNHTAIAWAKDLLVDQNGATVGFLMPAIQNSQELPSVYNPKLRKRKAPGFNWYYLHIAALNTAWIIQAIHAKGYVLGDIKPQNILVSDRALVAVIDTDSFQVRDAQGKVYRCTVGSEGFTPVELLGQDFSTTDQTEVHDRFRLAVLIHYLLFGCHPFSGEWTGVGDPPEQTELIRRGFWAYGQNSLILPSQNTIPLDVVHPEIKRCFLQCFNDGHTAPHLRPSAEDWHNALIVAIQDLAACNTLDSHHYSRSYGKCYWCERKATLSVDIFPGNPGTASIPNVVSSYITTTANATPTTSLTSTQIVVSSKLLSPTPIHQKLSTVFTNLSIQQKAIVASSVIGCSIGITVGLFVPRHNEIEPVVTNNAVVPAPNQDTIKTEVSGAPSTSFSQPPSLQQSSYNPPTLRNSYTHNPPVSDNSYTYKSYQQFSLSDFPKVSCGDPLPSNSSDYPVTFYPVFVNFSEENLIKARTIFCQDALKKRRKDSGELSVQVASFVSKDEAVGFAEFINSEFEKSGVGPPTIREERPF